MILFIYGAFFQYKEISQVCDCPSPKNVHANTFERYQKIKLHIHKNRCVFALNGYLPGGFQLTKSSTRCPFLTSINPSSEIRRKGMAGEVRVARVSAASGKRKPRASALP